jgi:hypothetical protein
MFLVWRGRFRVEFRGRIVELGPGELVVVPRGVDHRTVANEEAEVILLEPAGVSNTGNVVDDKFEFLHPAHARAREKPANPPVFVRRRFALIGPPRRYAL